MVKKRSTEEFDLSELQTKLREAGLRSTSARIAVLKRLRQAKSPMAHSELADDLAPLGFDKATIFRNLADLTDVGLVVRTELGDHVWRFEVRDEDHQEDGQHPHFVCVDCGTVTCVEQKTLEKGLKSVSHQFGQVTEIVLRGHCKSCR